ncbi:hypothetical protein C0J52_27233, partial [Blattella germanica]
FWEILSKCSNGPKIDNDPFKEGTESAKNTTNIIIAKTENISHWGVVTTPPTQLKDNDKPMEPKSKKRKYYGSILDEKHSAIPHTSEDDVERIQQAIERSLCGSTRRLGNELGIFSGALSSPRPDCTPNPGPGGSPLRDVSPPDGSAAKRPFLKK